MTPRRFAWTRRDRLADWAVIAVVVAALLAGWGVMAAAQGQRRPYADAEAGLAVDYPAGWLLDNADGLAFRAVDPHSGQFATAYEVRVEPMDATSAVTPALALALSNASIARAAGGQATAYRLLDLHEGPAVGGRESMEARYVYVDEGTNLFARELPVVVRGLDIAVAEGGRAYLFSLHAAADRFDRAERDFRALVGAARLGQ